MEHTHTFRKTVPPTLLDWRDFESVCKEAVKRHYLDGVSRFVVKHHERGNYTIRLCTEPEKFLRANTTVLYCTIPRNRFYATY